VLFSRLVALRLPNFLPVRNRSWRSAPCPKPSFKIGPRRWLCSKAVTGLNRGIAGHGQPASKCIKRARSKR